jgi:hypothetical protein
MCHLAQPDTGQAEGAQVAARAAVDGVAVADPGGAGVARLAGQLARGVRPLLRRAGADGLAGAD